MSVRDLSDASWGLNLSVTNLSDRDSGWDLNLSIADLSDRWHWGSSGSLNLTITNLSDRWVDSSGCLWLTITNLRNWGSGGGECWLSVGLLTSAS